MRLSIFSVVDHYPARERTVAQLYAELIAQAELAEQLGYDTFWIAEHHFHEYGAVPNPAVMLSVIAQRTRTLKLGTAISILTFHNPLTVAESYAMLDVLSGGRLMYGVGSGYVPHEFAGYGIDPAEKRERFDENLAAVTRLLGGGHVSAKGRFHTIDNVQLNVQPLQRPVPLYVAILRKEAAYHVGRAGHNMMCVPYASLEKFDDIGDLLEEYRRGRGESASPAGDNACAVTLHTHVAETDAQARRNAEAAFELYVATRLYAKKATYDDALRSGLHLMGSVETVADKLVTLARMGCDHFMAWQDFGLLPHATVRASMQRLMHDVMPLVRARIGAEAAAK